MRNWENIAKNEVARFNNRKKSGLKKCPGHWINKGCGVLNENCYDEDGKCSICGAWKI